MKNKLLIISIVLISFFSFTLNPKADENIPISDTYFRLDTTSTQILPGFIETNYTNLPGLFLGLNIYVGPNQTLKKDYVYKAVFIISTNSFNGDKRVDFPKYSQYRSFGRVVGTSDYSSPITYLSSSTENLPTGTFAPGFRYTILFKANADFNGISLQVLKSGTSLFLDNFRYEGAAIYQVSNADNAMNEIVDILGSQNQQIIEQNKETNNKLDDLNNNLTDDNVDGAINSGNDFFDNFKDEDYGFSDIVKMPLTFINKITSSTCTPLTFPLPFVDTNVELPCMMPIYRNYFGNILTIYQTITFGMVAYWVCINFFRMVKNFKNPDNDEIEVLDLW